MKVVNLRKDKYDVYIGLGSSFGNPCQISRRHNREQALEWYRQWFYNQLKDHFFYREVEKLRGKILGCYCKPLACHGDIIVEFLENTRDEAESDIELVRRVKK